MHVKKVDMQFSSCILLKKGLTRFRNVKHNAGVGPGAVTAGEKINCGGKMPVRLRTPFMPAGQGLEPFFTGLACAGLKISLPPVVEWMCFVESG